jgi:hypothetical protein
MQLPVSNDHLSTALNLPFAESALFDKLRSEGKLLSLANVPEQRAPKATTIAESERQFFILRPQYYAR